MRTTSIGPRKLRRGDIVTNRHGQRLPVEYVRPAGDRWYAVKFKGAEHEERYHADDFIHIELPDGDDR